MESRSRLFDTFQIVGFVTSTLIAIALIIGRVDPVQSTVIGLLLAVFTQLFDLQLRHASSEECLFQAKWSRGIARFYNTVEKLRMSRLKLPKVSHDPTVRMNAFLLGHTQSHN